MRVTSEPHTPVGFAHQTSEKPEKIVLGQEKNSNGGVRQGDVVNISEEGRNKSKYNQLVNVPASGDDKISETGGRGSSESVNPDSTAISATKLEERLQAKKSEAKRKQQKLDALKMQAESNPSQAGEEQKLKGEIERLKNEEKKIKSEMYR